MFEVEVQILLGATPREIMQIMLNILNLIEQLVFNHNWMSNTHLAAIAEAQGAEFVRSNGQTANHAEALRQVMNTLANSEDRVKESIDPVLRNNRDVGNALREVLRPLLDYSRNIRQTTQATLAAAEEVSLTNARRLEGVPLQTGIRGRASSVVQQLLNQAAALRARGIDPQLVPNASTTVRAAIADAEALAAEEKEAIAKATPLLVAMRQLIAAQLRAAGAVARAAIGRFLGPLETMLNFVAKAFGGRLTSPVA
jgi:hypothetical protein